MDWSELQNWDEYTKLLIGLLALANPVKSIPVLLGFAGDFSPSDKKRIIRASALTFAITLFLFLYAGTYILDLFGITIAAFRIAGGVLFLFYALDMIGVIKIPAASKSVASNNSLSLGITPLGIPLLAGPGSISTIIIYGSIHASFSHKILVMGVIMTVTLIIFLIFRTALLVRQGSGNTTIGIMNKVMGLMLAAIGVEFILDGLVAHFPQLVSVH